MTEDEIIELDFVKREVTIEESGNAEPYHYYVYPLNNDINLVSSDNTESGKRNWSVSVDYWGRIDTVDDLSTIIDFFKNINK